MMQMSTISIKLPQLPPGRPSAEAKARFLGEMQAFAERMKEIQERLPRKVSSRGWCYILEGMNVINKGQYHVEIGNAKG